MDDRSVRVEPRSPVIPAIVFGWPGVFVWSAVALLIDQLWFGRYSLLGVLYPFLLAGCVATAIAAVGSVAIRRPMLLLVCAGAMSTAGVVALLGSVVMAVTALFGGPLILNLKAMLVAAAALASAVALFRRVRVSLTVVHARMPNQAGLATALVALGALLAFGIAVLAQWYSAPASPDSEHAAMVLAPAKAGARWPKATPSDGFSR